MRRCFLLLGFLFFGLCAFCQTRSIQDEGLEFLNAGKYKQTIDFIYQIQALNPDSAEAMLSIKAFCLYKLHRHKQAQETLSQIEEFTDQDSISEVLNLYYLSRNRLSEELTERSLEMVEQDAELFLRQLKILDRKDLTEMAKQINEYLSQGEQEGISDYKTALALIYFAASDFRESYNQLSIAIEDYPLPLSYYIMGRLKAEQREYLSAISYYNEAESKGYKTLSLYKYRSLAKGFDQDFKGAIEDLDLCIEYRNTDDLYSLRSICYTNLMQYDKALRDINSALKINDSLAQHHNQKGIIQTNVGKYADAIMSFQTALRLDPELNFIHNNLAIALEKAGYKDKAVEHYKLNIKKHPDHADSYFNLGRIAFAESKFKQAIKQLERSHELNPKFPDTQYLLGLAYIKTGNADKGCYYLTLALENAHSSAQEAINTYCQAEAEEQDAVLENQKAVSEDQEAVLENQNGVWEDEYEDSEYSEDEEE